MNRSFFAFALALAACDGTTGPVDTVDAASAVDAWRPPPWREIECIRLCDPAIAGCGEEGQCERDCERSIGPGLSSYCPQGGADWRTWECEILCAMPEPPHACAGAELAACVAACVAWSDSGAYCP